MRVCADVPASATWLAALPGRALVLGPAPAVTLILAVCGAFFRDIQFFVTNIMRLGMFLTPIFWSHENAQGMRATLYAWNPFSHYLDMFRMPLVAGHVPLTSWLACLAMSGALWVVAILMLARYRRQIVFLV